VTTQKNMKRISYQFFMYHHQHTSGSRVHSALLSTVQNPTSTILYMLLVSALLFL